MMSAHPRRRALGLCAVVLLSAVAWTIVAAPAWAGDERVRLVDTKCQVADGGVGPRLFGFFQKYAGRNGLEKPGHHPAAIRRFDGSPGLDDELAMLAVHRDQINHVSEAVRELQRLRAAGDTYVPLRNALPLKRRRRQPQALNSVADRLLVRVACNVADRDQHGAVSSVK